MGDENGVAIGTAHQIGVPPEKVRQFYLDHWPNPVALPLETFYRWQFLESPEHEGRDHNCVAVRAGELLGVMGVNRRRFRLSGKVVSGAELTSWVVSPDARGLGVGRGIVASIQGSYDIACGFSVTEAALPIYLTSGFRRLKYVPRYFRVYDLEQVREFIKVERLGERLAQQWSALVPTAERWEYISITAPELGHLAEEMNDGQNFFIRDAAYLDWRYTQHPVYTYESFLVKTSSGASAGVIVRQDETAGFKFMHLMDLLGSQEAVPSALAFIDNLARSRGCSFVDYLSTSTLVTRHMVAAGWFSTVDDDYLQLAHLFYPPSLRDIQTTSMIYWARNGMSQFADLGRLHLTKSDADMDRPTIPYYHSHGIETT